MNAGKRNLRISRSVFICVFLWLTLSLSACAPGPEIATPYRPPTFQATLPPRETQPVPGGGPLPAQTLSGSLESPAPTATPICTNVLSYLEDLTIEDGTQVPPDSTIDKRWLVENTGSCNWDSRYRLRLVEGDALGAAADQSLYPARSGTQVALRIVFTAPSAPGTYSTTWQAIAPDGTPFGDTFNMEIVVIEE
ncbi:MAG: NBR1-Ig-like domain-containing protein [Chloroflexota bacterium]